MGRSNTRPYTKAVYKSIPHGVASYCGYLYIKKAGGRVVYRSRLGSDVLIALHFDHRVRTIERVDLSEAERIYFNLPHMPSKQTFTLPDGSEYTPDLRVGLDDGTVVYIEIGYHTAKVADADAAQRLALAATEIEKTGAHLLVITDHIARGYAIENRRMLHGRLGATSDNEPLRQEIWKLLTTSAQRLSAADLVGSITSARTDVAFEDVSEAYWCVVARADAKGDLLFDHRSRLDAGTPVAISTAATPMGVSFIGALLDLTWDPFPALYTPPFGSVDDAPGISSSIVLEELGDERRKEFAHRLAIVRTRMDEPASTWAALAERFSVSVRMARYYWREYRRGGEASLLPGQRVLEGIRVCPQLRETIDKLYRNARQFSVRQVFDHPELKARQRELRAQGERVDLSYDQLMRYVREHLKNDRLTKAKRRGVRRLPPPPAFGQVDHTKQIVRPFQVLQVDGAWADVHCVSADGRYVMERARILYGVDVATRTFAGVVVLPGDEGEGDYLDVLYQSMSPKVDLLRRIGSNIGDYPVYGIPEVVITDRAWEFGAEGSRERLIELGVDVRHAAPYMPQMKGIVERAVGIANQYLLSMLPGATKSNPLQRGGRDAVAEALRYGITFERLTQFILRGLIDGYADIVHRELRCTPLEKWDQLTDAQGMPRRWALDSPSQQRLQLFRLRRGKAVVRDQRGYEWNDRFYRPARADAPKKAIFYYDPQDIRWIAIYSADGNDKGSYNGPATTRDLDLSQPVPLWLGEELRAPAPATRGRRGREALTEILADAEAGKKLSKAAATRYTKAIAAASAPLTPPAIPGALTEEAAPSPNPSDPSTAVEPSGEEDAGRTDPGESEEQDEELEFPDFEESAAE